DIRLGYAPMRGKNEVMRTIQHLALIPRRRQKPFARFFVRDDNKFPRLRSIRRRRKDERIFKGSPVFRRNFLRRIELLRGVTPVELREQLLAFDWIHAKGK